MQFFQLQMSLHHPQDAATETSGAFAVDWDVWKVRKLACFSVIFESVIQTNEMIRFCILYEIIVCVMMH